MSDVFEDRERAMENKFARDEELRFMVDAQAIKFLGLWAANQLGYKDGDTTKYADRVSDIYMTPQGLQDVFKFIKNSFIDKGLEIGKYRLEDLFRTYQERARSIVSLKDMNDNASHDDRIAKHPYPKQWERKKTLADGRSVLLRPVKPEDESLFESFIQKCDLEDIRQRLFEPLHGLPRDVVVLFTHIDYARTMVFVALDEKSGELLGLTHLISDSGSDRAEYAVMTRSDVKKHGIGLALTELLIDYARTKDIGEIWGQVMRDNTAMLKICRDIGVQIKTDASDPIYLIGSLRLKGNKR